MCFLAVPGFHQAEIDEVFFSFNVFLACLKSTLFQALVEQNKSAGLPAKHFEAVALFVDENKQIAAHGILIHLAGNNPTQPVKAFAHVGWLAIEKVPSVADGKHYLK